MRAARIAGILSIAAVAAFVAARWLWPDRSAAPLGHEVPATAPAPSPATEALARTPAGALRAEPGGTIAIDAASLEPGRPVVLYLAQGESSPIGPPSDAPRPARIFAADGSRSLEGSAIFDSERGEARFEVDAAFLKPGRYIVEMRVPSLLPLNLARYVVEVR